MKTVEIPTVPITDVILTFNTNAQIIGQFGDTTFADGLNMTGIYTKSGSSYNAVTHEGGADSYAEFKEGSAASTNVSLGDYSSETVVSTPWNYTHDGVTKPTITIVLDLSRMLRFFNGMSPGESGVNPPDPPNKSYFLCHTAFRYSVAGFIGDIGKIQGYETLFTESKGGSVKGWMTLILDGEGKFLAGNLLGDDDNDFTIAKGCISSFTDSGSGSYTVTYQIGADGGGISTFTIDAFQIEGAVGEGIDWSGGPGYSGKATFTPKPFVQ